MIDGINAAMVKALADPSLRKRLDEIGIIAPRRTGSEFAEKYIQHEITKWTEILRKAPERP